MAQLQSILCYQLSASVHNEYKQSREPSFLMPLCYMLEKNEIDASFISNLFQHTILKCPVSIMGEITIPVGIVYTSCVSL